KGADPLGPDNVFVISVGPLDGTLAPSSNRYSVVAKSPLTGLIGYSNSGGHFGPELKYAGYDAIFVHGKAENPVYLYIDDGFVQLRDAKHLWGKDVFESDKMLREEVGDEKAQVLNIGQAGENKVRFAAVMNNLYRAAARTGVGAVMGSKNLKAVVVRGTGAVEVAHPEKFDKLIDDTLKKIYADPAYPSLSHYGTPFLVDLAYISGGLATRNNQTGVFEKYEAVSAETFDAYYRVKSESCAFCPIHCGKYAKVKTGKYKGAKGGGPEYETIVCLGTKCGIGDYGAIIYANELANKYGMDTISLGDTIAFAMEAYEKGILTKKDTDGLELTWGNDDAYIELVKKTAFREGFGDKIAEGTLRLSKMINKGSEKFALHVKGMEPPAYDVRTAKAFGLGWATATRGADHLAALPNFELLGYPPEKGVEWFGSPKAVDPYAWEGKPRMVYWHENFGAVVDSAEMCKYTCFSAYAVRPEDMALFITYATGWEVDEKEILRIGERIYNIERLFNLREGMTKDQDWLPDRFTKEPLPEGPAKGQVVELDKMLPEYYKLRMWDWETGYPKEEKLKELGLLKDAKKYGLIPK
ncbi:MAG: aldehyde ferredoxin oxidoreductase family protein, partial [Candidatus Odinarchaeota archaeon]|nr:aldehyde ferredoxin oxidoreductase family protein [Candidatus Odinarchaeota archaeon]